MEGKGDFLAGVIVGALIGGVAGILLAPASGKKTREQIGEKGKEVKDLAVEKAQVKKEAAAEAAKDLISRLKEKLPYNQEAQDALSEMEKDY